jgi:hypothetical protein
MSVSADSKRPATSGLTTTSPISIFTPKYRIVISYAHSVMECKRSALVCASDGRGPLSTSGLATQRTRCTDPLATTLRERFQPGQRHACAGSRSGVDERVLEQGGGADLRQRRSRTERSRASVWTNSFNSTRTMVFFGSASFYSRRWQILQSAMADGWYCEFAGLRTAPASPARRRRRTRSPCARRGRCGSPAASRRDHPACPTAVRGSHRRACARSPRGPRSRAA